MPSLELINVHVHVEYMCVHIHASEAYTLCTYLVNVGKTLVVV